jgi:hypothetical protein
MTFGSTFGRTFSPTFQPKSQAANAASTWWDLNGTITSCVAAYQPKGSASYAASKLDLTSNNYDLSDGTAPSWDATTGWTFADSAYLVETNAAVLENNFTLVAYGTFSAATGDPTIVSSRSNAATGWMWRSDNYGSGGKFGVSFVGVADNNSDFATANGFCGLTVASDGKSLTYYLNSSSGNKSFGSVVKTPGLTGFVIGSSHINTTTYYNKLTGTILALAIYNTALTSTQMGNLNTAMAAL